MAKTSKKKGQSKKTIQPKKKVSSKKTNVANPKILLHLTTRNNIAVKKIQKQKKFGSKSETINWIIRDSYR